MESQGQACKALSLAVPLLINVTEIKQGWGFRCFAYGGSQGRPLYDPERHPHRSLTTPVSKREYMNESSPSLNHFYDKLLRLKDGMKTGIGQKLAEER